MLLEATGDGVLVVDAATGAVTVGNPRAASCLGLQSIPRGAGIADIVPGAWYDDHAVRQLAPEECPIDRAMQGETFRNYRVTLRLGDGAVRELRTAGGAVDTPPGRRAYVVLRDLTELRRLERVKEEIMQVMVHECRNPLQVMKGAALMLSLCLQRGELARAPQFVDSVSRQVDAVSEILSGLVNALEVTSNHRPLPTARVNFGELFSSSVKGFRINGGTKHDIHVDVSAGDGLWVRGDESRLAVMLDNLLGNAAKYTPLSKQIWLSCGPDGAFVAARVADEGIGIPPGDLERVFDGFYRSPSFADWGLGGTFSLGLYISRSIARWHGGDLWAENRDGGGTVMLLRLPLASGAPAGEA